MKKGRIAWETLPNGNRVINTAEVEGVRNASGEGKIAGRLPRGSGDKPDKALARFSKPEIFNATRGASSRLLPFIGRLASADMRISMDGRCSIMCSSDGCGGR